jgi:hypothetical protein
MSRKHRLSVVVLLTSLATSAIAAAAAAPETYYFYDKYHAPELASIPGFTGAQRMIMARPDSASIKGTKYLALFTVETGDLAAVKRGTSAPADSSARLVVIGLRQGFSFLKDL